MARTVRVLLLAAIGALAACSDGGERAGGSRRAPLDERWPAASLRDPGPNPDSAPDASAVRSLLAGARARQFGALIEALALSEGVDPALVRAVIAQESGYDPNAVSPAGAAGLMQLMPATATDYGLTPDERFDPAKNLRAGIRHLKMLQRLFNNDLDLVLAAYNAGQGNVIKYGRRIPPFAETREYVRKVQRYYAWYGQGRRRYAHRVLWQERTRADENRRGRSREAQVAERLQGVL